MPKKYYQNRKDRRDESRGMKRYEERMHDSYRRVTGEDRMGMISEDHNDVANLPQEVVYRPYPKMPLGNDYYLDDTIVGVDDNLEDSKRTIDRHQSESMY